MSGLQSNVGTTNFIFGEPPSVLGHDTANHFEKLLIPIIKSDVGVIMITHDLGFAENLAIEAYILPGFCDEYLITA